MSSTKNINFEYLGLIILSFFPLYSFFLVSVAIFIYVIFALISKFTNKKRLRKKNHTIIFLHIVFYLLLIARLFFTENPIEGLKDLQPSLSLIIFPLIWLISNTSLDNKESDTLFKYFTLSSFILGLYILFFSLYFAFTTNQDFTIYYEQVKYFYAHPSYVTLYFLASIIFLFLTFGKRSKRIKIVSILLIGFFIFMIFVFSSRIVVLILFIIGLFELFRRVHISTYKKMMILMFSCLIILASVFLIKPLHKKVKETINPSALVLPQKKFPTSTQIRLGIYNCSYPIIKENWLLGIGGINFEREINICYDKFNNHDKISYNSHNYYLYVLGSSGIFCLLILLLLLFYHFKNAIYRLDYFYIYFLLALIITLLTENFLSRVYGVVFTMFFLTVFMKSKMRETNE